MKTLRTLFALSLIGGLVACADDDNNDDTDTGGTQTDTGNGEDTGGGGDTGGTDAEICDDGVDNDGDGLIDCADPDCEGSPACTTAVEICDDGADNDGNGLTDCDDPACATHDSCLDCPAGTVPRGGDCVGVWDGETGDKFSFISAIQLPPNNTDAECCFDFDNDGFIDNGLSMLIGAVGALAGDFDLDETLTDALIKDDIALVLDWGKGPDENGFWIYLATNDLNGDGSPDQSWSTRSAGDGVFGIKDDAIDEYGSLVQFNAATDDGTEFVAGPSLFRLNIPIDAGDFALDLDLSIVNATVSGAYEDRATGRFSVDETFDIDGEELEFGGWALGGVVPLDQIGALLDDLAGTCECAGFDTTQPIVTYGDDGTQYNLGCVQTPTTGCTSADGAICGNLVMVCQFIPSLPNLGLNDIDTNGNGVGDALSVGIRLSAVGATIGEAAVVEPGEEGDDCVEDDDCAGDLVCGEGDVCAVPAVVEPGEEGDDCVEDDDCAGDLVCGDDDTCELPS